MNYVPDHIQIRLQHSEDFHSNVKETCLKQIDYPRKRQLKRISVYIGEMSQALRSALNNTMWDFCERKLKNVLPETEYEKVRWSHDFPIERNEEKFRKSKSRVLRHIDKDFPKIHQFLESVQPYHKGYRNLSYIRTLSNDTTHTIPVVPHHHDDIQLKIVGAPQPVIRGNKVIVKNPNNGLTVIYSIPCYVREMTMYVSSKKKWVIFLMSADGEKYFSPTPFSKSAPSLVNKLITEFYNLW
jgi:hypothetical protein